MFSKKNIIRILFNTLLGVVLIYFWVKIVNINEVLDILSKVNLWSVSPFIVLFGVASGLRSLRLKIILEDYKIPWHNLLYLTFLGQLLSFTIPLRVGEVAKAVYLTTNYPIVLYKSIVWIFLDRFLDFWLLLVLVGFLLLFIPINLPIQSIQLLIIAITTISILMIVTLINAQFVKKIRNLFVPLLFLTIVKKKFVELTDFLIDNVNFLNKGPVKTPLLFVLTFSALITEGIGWLVLFQAVFGAFLDFPKILLGSLLSTLTFLIPAAPGYVGSAEASALVVFSFLLGFDKTLTSAAAVLNHGLTLICILGFGIFGLYMLKFNLDLVWKKFRKN